MVKAYQDRAKAECDRDKMLAYNIALLHRVKKFPSVQKWIAPETIHPKLSAEELAERQAEFEELGEKMGTPE